MHFKRDKLNINSYKSVTKDSFTTLAFVGYEHEYVIIISIVSYGM